MVRYLPAFLIGAAASFVLNSMQGLVYAYQPIPYAWLNFLSDNAQFKQSTVYTLLLYSLTTIATLGIAGGWLGMQRASHMRLRIIAAGLGAIIIYIGFRLRFIIELSWHSVFPLGWQHIAEIVTMLCVLVFASFIMNRIKKALVH